MKFFTSCSDIFYDSLSVMGPMIRECIGFSLFWVVLIFNLVFLAGFIVFLFDVVKRFLKPQKNDEDPKDDEAT